MREIYHLEGPIKPVPMTLLEIDSYCGLVVGINGYVVDAAMKCKCLFKNRVQESK